MVKKVLSVLKEIHKDSLRGADETLGDKRTTEDIVDLKQVVDEIDERPCVLISQRVPFLG